MNTEEKDLGFSEQQRALEELRRKPIPVFKPTKPKPKKDFPKEFPVEGVDY